MRATNRQCLSLLCVMLSTVQCQTLKNFFVSDKDKVTTSPVGPVVAFVELDDTSKSDGWVRLVVKTNSVYTDKQQARAAGIGEGYVTADQILYSWVNTLAGYCADQTPYCVKLDYYLLQTNHWLDFMVNTNKESSYWRHIDLIRIQINGMFDGFNAVYPGRLKLSDFLLMNLSGDLEDLEQALGGPGGEGLLETRARKHMLGTGSCSALIKWVPGDLMTSHITWNSYQSMVRVMKNYVLNFKDGNKLMKGRTQVFSSYPGYITSGDDYSLIGSGLATMETTIGNSNSSLWEHVHVRERVPEFMRAVLANRLAGSGKEWTEVFSRYNSGTYNNEWMIVDYNKFDPTSEELADDTLWVLEQIPGTIVSSDQTDVLRKQQYWPSYNTPFYPEIFNLSGCQASVDKYGPMFAYASTPRALIFARDQHKVVDMDSLFALMRYNDYKHDPLSACPKCDPPYSAENAIAARSDLNPANGTYLLPFLGHRLHGATDYKGTNVELMKELAMRAISGPTSEQQPPFRWSTSDWKDAPHYGIPDLVEYPEITVRFAGEGRGLESNITSGAEADITVF